MTMTGGGGAASSSSSSGAAGAGSGGAQQAAGLLAAILKKKKKKKRQSGITAAKKRYVSKRKVKMGEMRALKSKRIREHNAKTKKLPKAERDKARREFKKKVETQFKEVGKRFPPARGLKDVKTVRELIDKLSASGWRIKPAGTQAAPRRRHTVAQRHLPGVGLSILTTGIRHVGCL